MGTVFIHFKLKSRLTEFDSCVFFVFLSGDLHFAVPCCPVTLLGCWGVNTVSILVTSWILSSIFVTLRSRSISEFVIYHGAPGILRWGFVQRN